MKINKNCKCIHYFFTNFNVHMSMTDATLCILFRTYMIVLLSSVLFLIVRQLRGQLTSLSFRFYKIFEKFESDL